MQYLAIGDRVQITCDQYPHKAGEYVTIVYKLNSYEIAKLNVFTQHMDYIVQYDNGDKKRTSPVYLKA